MIKIPRIAVYRAEGRDFEQISALLTRHEYSVRIVNGPRDIVELMNDEGSPFDAAIVGMGGAGGSSGVSICLSMKANDALSALPILALIGHRDKAMFEAFFGAGADVVMVAPFDADLLYFQISALSRQKRAFEEELTRQQNTASLRSSVIQALNCSREGLLIADPQFHPIFVSETARMLLDLSSDDDAALGGMFKQFYPLLQSAAAANLRRPGQKIGGTQSANRPVVRADGQTFQAQVRICPLFGSDGLIAGYALGLSDLSDVSHLKGVLRQGKRISSLAILAASGCMRLLRDCFSQVPISAFSRLEEMLDADGQRGDLNSVFMTILEIIDLTAGSSIQVKVDLRQNYTVAMNAAHLFQLLGHVLLCAVDYVGVDGEISVVCDSLDDAEEIAVIVTAESKRVTAFLPDDYLSDVAAASVIEAEKHEDKLLSGLEAAQKVAGRYQRTVEYKQAASVLKVRLKLPLEIERPAPPPSAAASTGGSTKKSDS